MRLNLCLRYSHYVYVHLAACINAGVPLLTSCSLVVPIRPRWFLTWTALWKICNQGNTLYKKTWNRNKYRLCHRWREREWLHVISLQYQAMKAKSSDAYLLYKRTVQHKPLEQQFLTSTLDLLILAHIWSGKQRGRGIWFEERGWEDSIWGWACEVHCNEYRKKRRKRFRFA